jgi:hypothetical protein
MHFEVGTDIAPLQAWFAHNSGVLLTIVPVLIWIMGLGMVVLSPKVTLKPVWAIMCFVAFPVLIRTGDRLYKVGVPAGAILVILLVLFGPEKDEEPRSRTAPSGS